MNLAKTEQGLEEEIKGLEAKQTARQKRLEELETLIDNSRNTLQKSYRELDSKRNEYKLLKSWVDNREGFSASVKFLNKQNDWKKAPLLSDIFSCPQEYRASIEGYLDIYLNYYIVENLTEALKAISLLDKHQKGKAQFFLLDRLAALKMPTIKERPDAVCAASIIETDDIYRALLQHLLGKVYVVDTMEQIPADADKSEIWITKDAKFLQRAFTLRGGSVGEWEGKKIGRKKDLERLTKAIATLEETVNKLKQEQSAFVQEQKQLRQDNPQSAIHRLQNQLTQSHRQAATLKAQMEQFDAFREDAKQQQDQWSNNIEHLLEEVAKMKKQQKTLQDDEEEAFMKLDDHELTLRRSTDQLSHINSEYNRKNIEWVRQQNRVGGLKRELEFAKQQIREVQAQVEKDKATIGNAVSDLEEANKQCDGLEDVLIKWREERNVLQKDTEEAEKIYFKSRGDITSLEEELRRQNKSLSTTTTVCS